MKNIIAKEWVSYKKELEMSINEAIKNEPVDKDIMELMLEMLKNSKLKKKN